MSNKWAYFTLRYRWSISDSFLRCENVESRASKLAPSPKALLTTPSLFKRQKEKYLVRKNYSLGIFGISNFNPDTFENIYLCKIITLIKKK